MKEFFINENDAGQRLDKFVLKATVGLPKSLMYKAIRTKKIKVNRKRCEVNQFLAAGDTVQMFLAPEFFGEGDEPWKKLTPSLNVVYEDENILLCDKEAGLSCHSDETQKTGTLIDHIKAYLFEKGSYDPERENSFAPALCNRIDRNTSGLVICAKTAVALREINEMIRERQVQKEYLAWAHGKWEKEGLCTLYLKKDSEKNLVRVSPTPAPEHLTAITEFYTLRYDAKKDRTLIRILLHTGRTHQIRASAAWLGHPLVGDSKYGKDHSDPEFHHQALRAHSISFKVPQESPLFYLDGRIFSAPESPLFASKNKF